MLRIPGWAKGNVLPSNLYEYQDNKPANWTISVDGIKLDDVKINQSGYVEIKRKWKKGDKIDINLPMKIRKVAADKRIECNIGKTAIERGPIVYCAEGADNHGRVLNFEIDKNAELKSEFRENLLGGVTVLTASANKIDENGNSKSATLTMIPYYSWCNRGANEMSVWLKHN
jgi:DUF1680 family protein